MDTNSKFQHIEMTAEIIAASGPQRPADRVLKERLRNMPPSQSRLKRDISESVFAWFKWRRWPEALNPDHYGILQALSLHHRFQSHPDAFDAELLRQRVIPAWIDEHLRTNNAWIQTLQQNPCIWLRARPGTRASLGQELGGVGTVASGILEDSMEFCGEEDLFRTNAFHRGCFEIQDVCSQAVGLICGPRAGESWWDVCAGEGGKMLHLSDMMVNKGLIWATDPARWRLQKLKRRAARAGVFNYRAVHWQATGVLPTKNRFDGVLVDAPCSGIGTWQRNPHARWTTPRRMWVSWQVFRFGF